AMSAIPDDAASSTDAAAQVASFDARIMDVSSRPRGMSLLAGGVRRSLHPLRQTAGSRTGRGFGRWTDGPARAAPAASKARGGDLGLQDKSPQNSRIDRDADAIRVRPVSPPASPRRSSRPPRARAATAE